MNRPAGSWKSVSARVPAKNFTGTAPCSHFEKGDLVSVEGVSGFDVGEIQMTGEIVRIQLKKKGVKEDNPEIKRVLRPATDRDIEVWKQNKAREKEALIRSRAIAKQLNLNMKMSQVEIQADGKKATFFYIADDRVDFRELIKIYASEFKLKVEMRQIGARQEAGKVGGIGSCGRELCCATWLTDFKSVNTAAARYQNLSINQTKLSGQCGRLKCCLNYELDTYLDALQGFPENADMLQVASGTATLIKKDIFRNLMWYVLPNSNKQYPVTIERVRKIRSLNNQGVIPEELEAVEVVSGKPKELEPEFVDVVGQISLKSLERADKKRRDQRRQPQGQGPKAQGQGGQQQRGLPRSNQQGNSNGNGNGPTNRTPQGQQRPLQPGQGQKPKVEGKGGQQQQRPKGEQGQQKSRPPQPRPQQQRPTIKKDNNPPKQEG
jgi:cell fate regulator YaaT (PSP1 superfamily)